MNLLFLDMFTSILNSGIGVVSFAHGFESCPGEPMQPSIWLLIAGLGSFVGIFGLFMALNTIPWSIDYHMVMDCPSKRCVQNFLVFKVFQMLWQLSWFGIGIAVLRIDSCPDLRLQIFVQCAAYPICAVTSLLSCVNLNRWLK